MQRVRFYAHLFIVLLIFAAGVPSVQAQNTRLNVVATTTLITDVARQVGGDRVTVTTLIPPDSDEHAFQPAPNDVAQVASADVLLVNGAGLEEFLGGLLESVGAVEPAIVSAGVRILAFGEHGADEDWPVYVGVLGVDADCGEPAAHDTPDSALTETHDHAGCDPHVWTDPANVMIWAENIAAAFAEVDPEYAETYAANAAAYQQTLESLDADLESILAAVPEDRRVLVTNHDFMAYFAARYGFEIVGTVVAGGSTLSEPDPKALAGLVNAIRTRGVTAIFAEISASTDLAEVIASETGIAAVTTLYSGSLSAEDGPASTYVDYMRYNAKTIADALTGSGS